MSSAKPFRVVDIGVANFKLAGFVVGQFGGLRLVNYALRAVPPVAAEVSTADEAWLPALKDALADGANGAREICVCAPAGETFFRLFKVPVVPSTPFRQLVEFEARQQVPLPLSDLIWDYQTAPGPRREDSEVIFAAVRRRLAESLTAAAETRSCKPVLIEAPPAALANALRFNYGDLDGCSLLLDLGAHSTQVVLCEPDRFFARTVNLGAGTIAREFAQQAQLPLPEAERRLIEAGFVGPEDGYSTEDPRLNLLGKATRQVLTRLCVQVHQTIQHYRAQHGGAAPSRLLLAGGLARMSHLAEFLADRFHPSGGVEVFNPLRNVELDPALDVETLAAVAHQLGPVIGTALRRVARCPVELDLLPPAVHRQQGFRRQLPWAVAAAAGLALALLSFSQAAQLQAQRRQSELLSLTAELSRLQHDRAQFAAALASQQTTTRQLDQYLDWLGDRRYWAELATSVNALLSSVQARQQAEISPRAEIWVDRWIPVPPSEGAVNPLAFDQPMAGSEVTKLRLFLRARDLSSVRPEANAVLAFALKDAFTSGSSLFTLASVSNRVSDDRDQTFKLEVTLQLKRPMKL
jgi:type IV pilus assembly protein PilM